MLYLLKIEIVSDKTSQCQTVLHGEEAFFLLETGEMNPPQIGRRAIPVAEDRKTDNSSSAFCVHAFICVICHRLGSGCVFYLKNMGCAWEKT